MAYDALLVVSFGGPEGPADVMPFLRNVTAGRGVPDSRLEQVAEHYYRFGGVSPINQQCRDLILAVQKDFEAAGIDLPVYWGNRNWRPYLADTLRAMADDGVGRALAFVTSAYSSYSSCRQYLEDIERARAGAGGRVGGRVGGQGAPVVDKIWPYYGHPAFAECFTAAATAALDSLPASVRDQADLVFTAHSIPDSMAERSGPPGRFAAGRAAVPQTQSPTGGAYPAQLAQVAGRVAAALGGRPWRLAYSSRSGPPAQPWLGPDVSDCLTELAEAGSRGVVAVPIGFVSDHMEVKFDLDIEAAETAARLGLPFARAATPGTSPGFVAMITDLVRQWQAGPPPGGGFCTPGCCVPLARPQAAR